MHRAIQFSIFPSLPESSTPSPLAGGEGWDGGEKHGLGTPPACTPTLALPLAQGEGKDRQARVRKLNGPGTDLTPLVQCRDLRGTSGRDRSVATVPPLAGHG